MIELLLFLPWLVALGFVWVRIRSKPFIRFGGLSFSTAEFLTGWLITGRVGSGKSISALHGLMVAMFKACSNWGALVIDDSSSSWERLQATADAHGRGNDVIILRASESEFDSPTFNLVGDRSITWDTYGKLVMETAVALGQRGDQTFFRTQAQNHISKGLEALYCVGKDVTLTELHRHLLTRQHREELIVQLQNQDTAQARALVDHFENEFLSQPAEQLGGVLGTLSNVLSPYTAPAIARTFCRPSSLQMDVIDQGKIIGLAIGQKYALQRLYIATMMKLLFFHHVSSRYDLPVAERRRKNIVTLWADEFQKFVTAGEDSGDHRSIDRIREARATAVLSTQSITSLVPPIGQDRARVLLLNLCNRVVLQAATEEDAQDAADFLGKTRKRSTLLGFITRSSSQDGSQKSQYLVEPYQFRKLRPHTAYLIHVTKRFKKCGLPPLDAFGKILPWFRWWNRFFEDSSKL